MRPAFWMLPASAGSPAAPEVELKADRVPHVLILKEVFLNGRGPFRMMVDTSAASYIMRPAAATQLGPRPVYAVEYLTFGGLKRVPAAVMDDLCAGPARDQAIEILITEVRLPGVDGVLGQSWLLRHQFLLDYRGRRLVLDAVERERGLKQPLRSCDGRLCIAAEVDRRRQDLAVDSGASDLVFRRPPPLASATLVTNHGSAEAARGSARLTLGPPYTRRMSTAEVNSQPTPGLLRASAFGQK